MTMDDPWLPPAKWIETLGDVSLRSSAVVSCQETNVLLVVNIQGAF